jgi:META domain.
MKVLKVHRGENLENSKWENFYAPIIGFEFKEGVLQKISVKETKLAANEIPADASSIKYDLVKVLETKADPLKNLNRNWICTEIKGIEVKESFRKPNLNINLPEMRISGNGGCNSFSGQILNLDFSKI